MMKDNYIVAIEVIAGLYGNGTERREKLQKLGYNYTEVQSIVNTLVKDGMTGTEAAARLKNSAPATVQNEKTYLEIDFDTAKYNGIKVNIIV